MNGLAPLDGGKAILRKTATLLDNRMTREDVRGLRLTRREVQAGASRTEGLHVEELELRQGTASSVCEYTTFGMPSMYAENFFSNTERDGAVPNEGQCRCHSSKVTRPIRSVSTFSS